jgi:NAD(P)-dependent dehydrogenase (short-subunit alcohol dehydrogenase family)
VTRVAVVTGAAAGIGLAVCEELEAEGWQVIAIDRRPMPRAGSLQLDLRDAAAVTTRLTAIPQVDALVNNAAVQLFKPLLATTVDEWDDVLAVNLRAPFVCLRGVAAQLIASRGAVVNVSSVHAVATSLSVAAYAASKGGLCSLTRAAALELAPHGVRVNSVSPGAVETDALREGFARGPDAERRLLARTPLGRVGRPVEIARAVSFLLDGERSGFMTGQSLVLDGGALAQLGTEGGSGR